MRFLVGLVLVMISSTALAATSEKFGKGGWIQDFQPIAFHAISGAMIIDKFGYKGCPRDV
jgi:hypothetical protein